MINNYLKAVCCIVFSVTSGVLCMYTCNMWYLLLQGPISQTFLPSQFISDGKPVLLWLPLWPSNWYTVLLMDDSTAVMSSAKFGSDHAVRIKVRAKWNFHRIWIVVEKPAVKWTPGDQIYMHQKQASAILSDNTVLPIQHNTIIENSDWPSIPHRLLSMKIHCSLNIVIGNSLDVIICDSTTTLLKKYTHEQYCDMFVCMVHCLLIRMIFQIKRNPASASQHSRCKRFQTLTWNPPQRRITRSKGA